MKLTAVFETWHLGDGNYPPFSREMRVNLSFELMPEKISIVDGDQQEAMKQIQDAEYAFCGTVLKVYPGSDPIVVLQMGDFRCYINSFPSGALELKEGHRVAGEGRLLLDDYLWVEYLHKYDAAPNLFYNLTVKAIRTVAIPESFIQRGEKGYSHPCSLGPDQYDSSQVGEVEKMGDANFEFYLVDFDSTGLENAKIPKTFL